ncbi:MAG: winged helix-turn-helix domain-containing protein [Cyclobacteriaceae bacterium]|nr:winged helix-turn-helix domain-containing protein [Cyclobacteriaceae bacterium]
MLDTLITSKTRIKMLLKFFTNSASSSYLRGLAEEFGESTNAIRHELNNLSKAGYLVSQEDGRTIQYRANTHHPLYNEVRNLVHKYLGIDKIIDHVLSRLGDLQLAFIVGDYAQGKDSGTIELVLVGEVDEIYLKRLEEKAKSILHRAIKTKVINEHEFEAQRNEFNKALLVWGNL